MLLAPKFKLISNKNIKKKSISFTHFQFIQFGLHTAFLKKYWHSNTLNFLLKIENNYFFIFNITKTILMLNKALSFLKKVLVSKENIFIVHVFSNLKTSNNFINVSKKFHKDLIMFTEISDNIFYIGNKYWFPGFLNNFLTLFGQAERLFKKQNKYFQMVFRISTLKPININKPSKNNNYGFSSLTNYNYKKYFINVINLTTNFSINLKLKNLFVIFQLKIIPEILITFDNELCTLAIKEALLLDLIIITLINSHLNPKNIHYPIPINTKIFFSKKLLYMLIKLVFLETKIDYIKFFFK